MNINETFLNEFMQRVDMRFFQPSFRNGIVRAHHYAIQKLLCQSTQMP